MREIPDYGIADSIVPEIYLAALADFIPHVPRAGRKPEHHKSLLKKVDIELHRSLVDADHCHKFSIRSLVSDRIGKQLQCQADVLTR